MPCALFSCLLALNVPFFIELFYFSHGSYIFVFLFLNCAVDANPLWNTSKSVAM